MDMEMDRVKLLLDVLHGTMQLPALKLIHLAAMAKLQEMNDTLKPPAPQPAQAIPSNEAQNDARKVVADMSGDNAPIERKI